MDDIQRKLELIDKQLTGGFVNSYKRIISTAPLVFAAVGLIAGILIQDAFDLSTSIWLVVLAVCSALTVFLFVAHTRGRFASYGLLLLSFCALICFISLGGIRLTGFSKPEPDDIRNLVGSERTLATIRGSIITQPYTNRNEQWEFAKFVPRDAGSSFYLKVCEVETTAGWAKASGTVRVQVDEPVQVLKAGDYVQMYCWLDRFNPPTNPGQFDTAKYLAKKNVFVATSVQSRDAIEVLQGGSTNFFVKIKRKAREIAVQSLLGSPYPQDESEGLLQALVLGYRADMGSATYEAFRRTGLLHFVCLSGMNFGILVGMIWWLCKTAGLMKRARAAVCTIAAAMFVLVVPPNPPAFRAAIMCLVFCSSFFFRRQSNPFNSLSLAAIILLLIRPTELFEASWQLSFACVLGILLFADSIENFINEKVTALLEDPVTGKPRSYSHVVSRPASPVISAFSASLAAWLASAGILLYNFYTIQPLTSIWTVIASPLIAVISFAGYLKLLIGLVLPTAASILNVIIKPLSSWLIWLVKHIAQVDVSQMLIGHVAVLLVVFYYCIISFMAFINFKRPFVKKVISVLMVLAMIAFLGVTKWQRTYRDNLVLTVLDVGHGQAIVVQLPGKANVLFDAGSLDISDVGGRIVAPFLDYSGISKIDYIVISHNDVDHINGIPEVIGHCDVNDVYVNDIFIDMKTDSNGTAEFLKTLLSKDGFKIKGLKDLRLNSTARIKILWPSEEISQNSDIGNNDKSTVCLIEFAGRKVLLCSDIEKFAQAELLRIYPDLKADVVVVPHHGSRKTVEQHFLENLDADILICSCSQTQYERQQVIDSGSEAKTFYTARDGTIAVYIDKDGRTETYSTPDL